MKVFLLLCFFAAQAFGYLSELQGVKPGWQRPEMLAALSRLHPELNIGDVVSKWNSRVVNGNQANPNQFPYLAANLFTTSDGTYFCGASVISVNYVLTAAHCADGASAFTFYFGAHDVQAASEVNRQTISGASYGFHSGWDWNTLLNDIAYVRLSTAVTLNQYVQTIALPPQGSGDFGGAVATLAGWGATVTGGSIAPILRYVSNPILTPAQCSSYIGTMTGVVCFSGEGNRGGCSGDSGSPLAVTVDGVIRQVGIASFVMSGCDNTNPTGFTRVTTFSQWISDNTGISL